MNHLLFHILPTLLIASLIATTSGNVKCSSGSPLIVPKYHLMEKCHRSKVGIMAKANYTSLTSCQRLGIEKKALAFNFVPLEALKEIDRERKKNRGRDNGTEPLEPLAYTCEVLKCAEVDGGLSLVNDSRYDYYSLYAKPFPHINATCIPATGMFFLTPHKLNYTQARAACRNMSGVLADVVSEARTEALAQLLTGASTEAAIVALRRSNGSSFFGANGDSLDCSTYRAWAPGHPRRARLKFDCVLVTGQKTWRSTPCNQRYPALCELNPGGPYKRGSIFASLKPINNTEAEAPNQD
ncbi:uncharacterized protein [Choristoneura fumiferana]|uniref:uncharacterized protein n=1 Tax=Choristoneura fumiferana TaxID=7141 RepID=UPI003D15DDBB